MNRIKRMAALAGAALSLASANPALAAATDCAGRDAPFSVDSPLVDVLLSDAARGVLAQVAGGAYAINHPFLSGTTAPTFGAILTLRVASAMGGASPDGLAEVDAALRALPVTEADQAARCARFDADQPAIALPDAAVRVLVFSKVNGFVHVDALPVVRQTVAALGAERGWAVADSDNGGAITAETLANVDVVVWNNVSGDVLTPGQRAALRAFVEGGGGFVAVHGSGGDPAYFWDWYADSLLGARFIGHPNDPQFQEARLVATDRAHPVMAGVAAEWRMVDEWYSFAESPRSAGVNVLVTIDETTYDARTSTQDLKMGDHPLVWTSCAGNGRVMYSAIGHRPESYGEENHARLLANAIAWAAGPEDGTPCQGGR